MLKKPVILMVMSLVVIISATTITKNYSFNAPVIQEGCVFMDNCDYLGSSFNPDVAVKTTSLLLQQGHTVESFSVKYGEPILLQDNFNIRPFRPGGRISIEPPPDLYRTLGEAYTKDAFFPAITRDDNNYRIIYKNGHAIFVAMIKPVQYNPESKKVRYYPNISIQVNTVKANANQTPVYKCNKFIRSQLKEMVDNPETIDNLPDSPRGPNDYEYLIITGTSFKDRWTDFIAFNERRCLRTNVVTTDDIYGSGVTGKDNPDKIRNYIKKEYTDNNIVYVMLGGDVEIVPCRGMHTEFYDYGVNHYEDWTIAADLYYSCLDGTWQKPGSNYYGEYGCDEDVGWEVYASRFAVDNNTELANMINKTIMYSETPVANDVENVILGGEELWNQWRWDDAQNKYVQLSSKCYGGDNMEEMIGTCTNNGYTTVGWPSNINFSKLYEKDGSWTGDMKTKMISTIRNDKITFIDHLGHSNTNYILKMSTSDVNSSNFQNNGTNANFFIVYTQGCYPGSFDNKTPGGSQTADCIGEKFATLSTAAVAFISNTRYGLGADGREGSTGNSPYTDGSSSRF